jgi:hypothetical protein
MDCWRWFNGALKEAAVTVMPWNRAKVDGGIEQQIDEHAEYKHCSSNWTMMAERVKVGEKEKKPVEAVRAALK